MIFNLSKALVIKPSADFNPQAPSDDVVNALYESEGRHLMLESVTMEDVELTYFDHMDFDHEAAMMLEAITTSKTRLSRTMAAFNRALNQQMAGSELSAGEAEIGRARKASGMAVMPAIIPLSDGQTITVMFHSPTNDPSKIAGNDTLVAFRFLLNKRDVTHVVSPDGGRDVSLKQTCLSLANLAERNSRKFKASQDRAEKLKNDLAAYQAQAEQLEEEARQLTEQGDKLGKLVESEQNELDRVKSVADKQVAINDELRKEIEQAKQAKAEAEKVKATKAANHVPDSGKTPASGDLLKQLNPALWKSIVDSVTTIYMIDSGQERGLTRSLFVNSMAEKIKRQHKNGNQDIVDAALALIRELQDTIATKHKWDKPQISDRHSIWKLGSANSTPAAVESPAPADPAPDSFDKPKAPAADLLNQLPMDYIRSAGINRKYFGAYMDEAGGELEKAIYMSFTGSVEDKTVEEHRSRAKSDYIRELMSLPRDADVNPEILKAIAKDPDMTAHATGLQRHFDKWQESDELLTSQGDKELASKEMLERLKKDAAKAMRELVSKVRTEDVGENVFRIADTGKFVGERTVKTSVGELSVPMAAANYTYSEFGNNPGGDIRRRDGYTVMPQFSEDGYWNDRYRVEHPLGDVVHIGDAASVKAFITGEIAKVSAKPAKPAEAEQPAAAANNSDPFDLSRPVEPADQLNQHPVEYMRSVAMSDERRFKRELAEFNNDAQRAIFGTYSGGIDGSTAELKGRAVQRYIASLLEMPKDADLSDAVMKAIEQDSMLNFFAKDVRRHFSKFAVGQTDPKAASAAKAKAAKSSAKAIAKAKGILNASSLPGFKVMNSPGKFVGDRPIETAGGDVEMSLPSVCVGKYSGTRAMAEFGVTVIPELDLTGEFTGRYAMERPLGTLIQYATESDLLSKVTEAVNATHVNPLFMTSGGDVAMTPAGMPAPQKPAKEDEPIPLVVNGINTPEPTIAPQQEPIATQPQEPEVTTLSNDVIDAIKVLERIRDTKPSPEELDSIIDEAEAAGNVLMAAGVYDEYSGLVDEAANAVVAALSEMADGVL